MATKTKTARSLSLLISALVVLLILIGAFTCWLHFRYRELSATQAPDTPAPSITTQPESTVWQRFFLSLKEKFSPAPSTPTDPVSPTETTPPPQTEAPEETTLPPPSASPYDFTDFGYVNGYLTCLSGPCQLGVDVSSWQKTVDWEQVRSAGMTFAMIRLGYRGTEQGGLFPDDYAQSNYENAREAGLMVGGYFFSQAITPQEAREEAQYVLELIQGWDVDMPIVYDWEYVDDQARTAQVDARTLTDCTIAFCQEIEAAGYTPMVYFNPDAERKQLFIEELTDYKFWLAMYTDEMTYPYRVDMWQYTCTGSVPGISGNCDINILFEYDT